MNKKTDKTKYSDIQHATMFVVIITSFVTSFIGSATNLSIPDMSHDFGVGAAAIGWVVSAYMLPVAALSVPFGRIADITCRKTVLIWGIGIFLAGCFASAAAPNFALMIVTRIIQAVGAAMIFSTNHAILISEFPGNDRGRVLGYALASTYTGLSAGPVLGGIINHNLGWRFIFILTGILGVVVMAVAAVRLPKRKMEAQPFDKVGNLLYITMISLTIYGLNEFSDNRAAIILVPVGLIFAVLFVRRELKAENPLVDVRLFASNLSYSFSNLAALMNYGATYAIGYLLSIYLQVVAGYSSQTAGLILIAQPVLMAAFSPSMGKLSDRISPFKLASTGMGLCALCLILLAFISETTPVWAIIGMLCIAGAGFALFSSPNTNAVMSCIDRSSYGVASSVLATMRNLGHNMSMVIVTLIISLNLGNIPLASADPQEIISTMRIAYIVFTLICLFGMVISMKRKAPNSENN